MRKLAPLALLALLRAAPAAAQEPAPGPVRPLCVATPGGMRLVDTVAQRFRRDSVHLRTGERGVDLQEHPQIVYVLTAPGCLFQPYHSWYR